MKRLIFIDDSGDPGFKEASSDYLVMAAVVFDNAKVAERVSGVIADYRRELRWRDEDEFKFSKTHKSIVVELLRRTVGYEFEVYAVMIDKKNFGSTTGNVGRGKVYDWAIGELLKIAPTDDAKIHIDGHANKKVMLQSAVQLRRVVNPNHKKKMIIKYADSKKNNLIQLADLVVGSMARSLYADKTDSGKYLKIIRNKVIEFKEVEMGR